MKKQIILTLLLLICISTTAAATEMMVNFNDQPMRNIIPVIAEMTDTAIMYKGENDDESKITWIQKRLSKTTVIQNFKYICEASGYTIRKVSSSRSFYEVSKNPVLQSGTFYRSVGLYQMKYATGEGVLESLKMLFGEKISVSYFEENEVVVFTGSDELVREIKNLMPQIDQVRPEGVLKYDLKNISVKEAFAVLKNLKVIKDDKIYPDYWGNSILVNGSAAEKTIALSALVKSDVSSKQYDFYVYDLQQTTVDNVLPVIESMFPSLRVFNLSDGRLMLSGADDLITKAERMITKIDNTGLQVRVDAVIAYLTDKQYKQLGINLLAKDRDNNFQATLDTAFSMSFTDVFQDVFIEMVGLDLDLDSQAGNGSIVSSPTMVVRSGKTGTLSVGRNVPYVSEYNYDKNDGNTTGTSVERQDVGLEFSITPNVIRDGQFVSLDIKNIISSITPESDLGQTFVDVVIDKQEISSKVVVADGETIFIGGLKSEEVGNSKSYIPLLSEIPFIGKYLFTHLEDKKEKRNLVVSLRVKIIG